MKLAVSGSSAEAMYIIRGSSVVLRYHDAAAAYDGVGTPTNQLPILDSAHDVPYPVGAANASLGFPSTGIAVYYGIKTGLSIAQIDADIDTVLTRDARPYRVALWRSGQGQRRANRTEIPLAWSDIQPVAYSSGDTVTFTTAQSSMGLITLSAGVRLHQWGYSDFARFALNDHIKRKLGFEYISHNPFWLQLSVNDPVYSVDPQPYAGGRANIGSTFTRAIGTDRITWTNRDIISFGSAGQTAFSPSWWSIWDAEDDGNILVSGLLGTINTQYSFAGGAVLRVPAGGLVITLVAQEG